MIGVLRGEEYQVLNMVLLFVASYINRATGLYGMHYARALSTHKVLKACA